MQMCIVTVYEANVPVPCGFGVMSTLLHLYNTIIGLSATQMANKWYLFSTFHLRAIEK